MATYFVSFTSTFESLLDGKLVPGDLADGILVFGCRRGHVLVPYDQVPVEVLQKNKMKSSEPPKNAAGECSVVNRKLIDANILDMWDHFAAQIRKANLETRLIFMHKIGHRSYRSFSQEAVSRGDRVFWKGGWVPQSRQIRTPEINYEQDTRAGVPLPDQAFIDQILGETSSGSIQGYSH